MNDGGWAIGERVLVRGRRWVIQDTRAWSDCTVMHLGGLDGQGPSRTVLWPFDRPLRLRLRAAPHPVRIRRWLHEVQRHAANLTPYGGAVAARFAAARLLPYQLEPLLAVLRHGATRLLIADAVGLGKTIQAGLILLELAARDDGFRAMVLVPAGLREQWSEELATHLGLSPVQADAAWLRSAVTTRPPEINPWSLPGIWIVSIDFAKRAEVLQDLEAVSWDLVILDEAHLAAAASDRREAAHAIAVRSRRTVLLTATPDAGDPARFGALCGIGRVDAAEPPVLLFRRSRAEVSDAPARRGVLLRVTPSAAERRMHAQLDHYVDSIWREAVGRGDPRVRLAAIVLRKRALSSAGSLAVSLRRRIELLTSPGPPAQRQLVLPLADEDPLADAVDDAALSAPGLADAGREHRWLAALAEAAEHAAGAESKSLRLLRWLGRVREPVIVFTEYRDTLIRLEQLIRATGRPLAVLHGGLDRHERTRVQRQFNAGGLSLLATDAAAEGLNLHHHCRVVLHYELPWRPARLEQRAGRVDRLGQARRVHEIALVAAGTAERLVIAPLVARAARARAAGDAASGLLDSISEMVISDLVMNAAPPGAAPRTAAVDAPVQSARTLDLRREAENEVARLQAARAVRPAPLQRARRARSGLPATLVSRFNSRRSALGPGLILVLELSLVDGTGRQVHAESMVVALDTPSFRGIERSAASLRRLVDRLRATLDNPGAPLHEHLTRATQTMKERTGPIHQAAREEVQRREQALRCALPSAARHMVQAGLFDRRAIRTRSHLQAVRDTQLEDLDSRRKALEQASRLEAGYALAAALVVRGRRVPE